MRSRLLPGLILLVSLSLTTPAHAYVDPNSGGLVFQLVTPILALIAASLTFAKRQIALAWLRLSARVRSVFARLFRTSGRELK
jgi:hypothetical protein